MNMEWQPIATAPKDGIKVLIVSEYGNIWMAHWKVCPRIPEGRWESSGLGAVTFTPTHWMALPPAPEVHK